MAPTVMRRKPLPESKAFPHPTPERRLPPFGRDLAGRSGQLAQLVVGANRSFTVPITGGGRDFSE
jgi:hypothetical protein